MIFNCGKKELRLRLCNMTVQVLSMERLFQSITHVREQVLAY